MRVKVYQGKVNKDDSIQTIVSISFRGRRCQTGLGVSLTPGEFDQLQRKLADVKVKSTERVKNAFDLFKAIEGELAKVESGVIGGFIKPDEVDLLEIVNRCKKKDHKREGRTLQQIYIEYMQNLQRVKNTTPGTQEQQRKIINSLTKFGATFEQICTIQGLEKYALWLELQGLGNFSVRNYTKVVKSFLRWCFKHGYCSNDFERYECQLKIADSKEKAVIYLTIEEIEKISKLELDGTAAIVRDIFLFQCYTGLRISDAKSLMWSSINGDVMRITIKKTGTFIENKLPRQAMDILGRYRDMNVFGGYVFPQYSKERYRVHLHEIGRLAGLNDPVKITDYRNGKKTVMEVPKWQKLTTHVGRKTFVVNSLSMGFTANQVIKCTGHSTVQAMQPYIDITEQSRNAIADRWSQLGADGSDGRNGLIAQCRYYMGEDSCPFDENNERWFWDMERVWVSNNGEFVGEESYYKAIQGRSFAGVPYTLLIVLFTSWGKWTFDIAGSIEDFYRLMEEYVRGGETAAR